MSWFKSNKGHGCHFNGSISPTPYTVSENPVGTDSPGDIKADTAAPGSEAAIEGKAAIIGDGIYATLADTDSGIIDKNASPMETASESPEEISEDTGSGIINKSVANTNPLSELIKYYALVKKIRKKSTE